jgi:hypothetical protein
MGSFLFQRIARGRLAGDKVDHCSIGSVTAE